MNTITLKQLQNIISSNEAISSTIKTAKDYYDNKNTQILQHGTKSDSVLRNADNRIDHNFHQILVDEKASYMFTYKVLFQLDDKQLESQVYKVLGDRYEKIMKQLCIEASNAGVGWLHYWFNEAKEFKYAIVPSEQIISKYSNSLLDDELEYVIRYYTTNHIDENNSKINYGHIEYWTINEYHSYKIKNGVLSQDVVESNILKHTIGSIPFVPFYNNHTKRNDLSRYKKLIDLYDRITSGYANDLDDIQQIFFVLQGYGGVTGYDDEETPQIESFLQNIKKYKTIPLDSDEGGKFETIKIDIPVEARKILLDQLKKQIIESGQGLQQDIDNYSNVSGVALKFFYRRLEMKAGLLESEFRFSLNKLIREIARLNFNKEVDTITQTWTRNIISNDLETAQVVQMSAGIVPKELLLRYHPLVEDVNEALEFIEKEEKEMNDYQVPITGDEIIE